VKTRTIFFIILGIILFVFLYIERAILTPFILAGVFAYIFNPVVNFLSKKLHLPRTMGIIIIYTFLLSLIVITGALLTKRISEESVDINRATNLLLEQARSQTSTLPDWLQPVTTDFLITFKRSKFINLIESTSTLPIFSKAVSRIISFFIFLFSGFYFLRDGESYFNRLLSVIPHKYKIDVEIMLKKVNSVFNGYLRGQMFLVFLVSFMLYIALSIIGVKFSLTIAIFSGFAEIVPVVGPITAGAVATLVVLLTGTANFGLSPINAALIVIGVYFILRHMEDYFVIPHVMEKITKLPPFLIFFSVIAGGHLAGILGLILAVPIAAIIRIFLEFSFDKIKP
jgi:predicted PurR-regulated permease PerM